MSVGIMRSLRNDDAGAVAAIYAVALFALIAIAGVGFDYARLAAMDSELQNAADQAALAGVTQLDRETGACARASAAAVNLLTNNTLMANDSGGVQVTITAESACDATGMIRFYQDQSKATPATSDEDARFIEVFVDKRVANFALTPIVDAMSSGEMGAAAFAGIGSSICRTPPLMMCNPAESSGNTDVRLPYDADSAAGTGIRLVANDSYTPGSFGFLEAQAGSGANNLLAALGWDNRPGECVAIDGVEIKNGVNANVMDGINTRFDLTGTGNSCPNIGGITGECSPSVNARKDLVRTNNNCNWGANNANSGNFMTRNYRPTSNTVYPSGTTPEIMGHPRDLCHAWSDAGNCNSVNGGQGSRIGTGDWDINAYWRSNFGADYAGQVPLSYGLQPKGYPTRYAVYRWEADKIADGTLTGIIKNAQGSTSAYAQPQAGKCLATSTSPYGIVPGGANIDRRRISMAVLNCNALQAKYGSINNTALEVGTWADLFLVEPSISRRKCQGGPGCNDKYADKTDVYIEIIGVTDIGGDGSIGQAVRRDVPYLIE